VHSTAQLKLWTIQQTRTDALWVRAEGTDANLSPQSVRTNDPEHTRNLITILLPDGEYLVAFTSHKKILSKNIERGNDIGCSEWILTGVARRTPSSSTVARTAGSYRCLSNTRVYLESRRMSVSANLSLTPCVERGGSKANSKYAGNLASAF
jgi:hypothetical protein